MIRGSCRAAEWAGKKERKKEGDRIVERPADFGQERRLDWTSAFFISMFVWANVGRFFHPSFLFVGSGDTLRDRKNRAKPNLSPSSIKHGHSKGHSIEERERVPSIDQLRGLHSAQREREREREMGGAETASLPLSPATTKHGRDLRPISMLPHRIFTAVCVTPFMTVFEAIFERLFLFWVYLSEVTLMCSDFRQG